MCDSILDRITETEYDLSDRPCRIRMHENGQHLYTGEVSYDSLSASFVYSIPARQRTQSRCLAGFSFCLFRHSSAAGLFGR